MVDVYSHLLSLFQQRENKWTKNSTQEIRKRMRKKSPRKRLEKKNKSKWIKNRKSHVNK